MAITSDFSDKGIEGNSVKGAIKGFNSDGTVSFKDSAGSDIVANKSICKNFGYRWDNATQSCKWKKGQNHQKKDISNFKKLAYRVIGVGNKIINKFIENITIIGTKNEIHGGNKNGLFVGEDNYIGASTNNTSILGGGQHEVGRNVSAYGEYDIDVSFSSVLGGRGAWVKRFGEQVLCAGGRDNSTKGMQTSQFILTGSTTDNTATELFLMGEVNTTTVTALPADADGDGAESASDLSSATLSVKPNTTRINFIKDNFLATFTVDFMAYQTGGSSGSAGDSHTKRVQGTIRKVGSTTDLVGSVTNSLAKSDGLSCTFSVTADDTNDSLKIQVTGQNNKNVTYVVAVKLNQIRIPV